MNSTSKIPALNECSPGFDPVEYKVLVAPQEAKKVSAGGILLPEDTQETEGLAEVWGLLVSASPLAFNFDKWPDEQAHLRPKAGDTVLYGRYAGTIIKGDDGRDYRLMHDKDICAVKRQPEPA